MPTPPTATLDQLKAGFKLLEEQNASRRKQLEARLAAKGQITPEEEAWLDGDGNLVDEKQTLQVLSEAADYKAALQALSPEQKEAVARMRRVLEERSTQPGAKRKRMFYRCFALANKYLRIISSGPVEPKTTAGHVKKQAKTNPVFERKENATLAQRIEILDWHHAHGKNQSETAKHFDKIYPNLKLKQPTVSTWVKEEAMWRQRWEES
ncbi:hypothetical protein FKP32DRAFT_1636736, partial [Trametes sanguinea]